MALELSSDVTVCYKCGIRYNTVRGNFPSCYAANYRGNGRLPICKKCIEKMFNAYLSQCDDTRDAVRQMCRKLDLYWNEDAYVQAMNRSPARSAILRYIARINVSSLSGKSYDDTLIEENALWDFPGSAIKEPEPEKKRKRRTDTYKDITKDVIAYWGNGYTMDMYRELEQKKQYWLSRLPDGVDIDIGTEVLIRQICNLEVSIAKDNAAGRSIEKSVNSLNTLLGSLNLKPTQKKEETNSLDSTPFGVLIKMREDRKPCGDTTEDEDGIVKYILTWLYGHLSKMLGEKNMNTRLYDDAIEKYRVERPEYEEDEDDEEFLYDVFSSVEEPVNGEPIADLHFTDDDEGGDSS